MHIVDVAALLDLDRRAVLTSADLVGRLEPGDLDRPTPCAGWRVCDLLGHMTGQQLGFAAAAHGDGAELAAWAPSAAPYADACAEVIAAFGATGVAERGFLLPEIRDGGPFPAGLAISFHLLDNVVHAWDIAVSIGAALDLDDEVVRVAASIADQVPDGATRLVPGAAFAPGLPPAEGANALDRTLARLGRSPRWAPSITRRRASR